jgi:hypothetical protein
MNHGLFSQEITLLLVLFLGFGLAIVANLLFRKYVPGRLWLGILLAFVFGPLGAGQLYLRGGIPFMLGVFLFSLAAGFIVQNIVSFLLLCSLVSSSIIYIRFKYRPTF